MPFDRLARGHQAARDVREGYDHNNCIGCVKAGAWYLNKIRVDFPWRFQEQMELEEWLGTLSCALTE
jgi:hypothetical protein